MKKTFLPAIICLLLSMRAFATTYTIDAYNNYFSPADTLNVIVGDTITFQWIEGIHTTSSNGIPFNAEPWNVLLDSAHQVFTYVVLAGGTFDYISVPDEPGMHGTFIATFPAGITDNSPNVFSINILQNPVAENIRLNISAPAAETISLLLIDISGKQVLQHQLYVSEGENSLSIPLPLAITSGSFILVMKNEQEMQSAKIIVSR